MRRISVFVASIAISFVMALSGLAFCPAHASSLDDGNYLCSTGVITTTMGPTYTITADVVSAGTSCAGDVVIPEGVKGINAHGFSGAGDITSISFADDGMLTYIGAFAFEWNIHLKQILIPASVTTIGLAAFYGDLSLTSLFFLGDDPAPNGDIFWASQLGGYESATKAYFRTGATGFASDIDGKWNGVPISPFYKLTFEGTDSESGSVPSPIFSGAGDNVTIPDNTGGLMRAGYNFAGWTDGDGNPYPAGLVGPMPAFDGTLLAAWTPSNSNVLVDGKYACGYGTYTITTVGSDVTVSDGSTCTGALVIPEGVTAISASAFDTAIGLRTITIPASVIDIGAFAFYQTSLNIINFDLNSQLTSIGAYAFYGETSLTAIAIPASVTSIGTGAFQDAFWLNSITFGVNSQLTSIGAAAFYGASITYITIPASVNSIGDSAFQGANSLSSIYFLGSAPNSVGLGVFNDIGASPKAHVNSANASTFTLDGAGLWNGLTVVLPIADGSYLCSTGAPTSETTNIYKITTVGSDVIVSDGTCTGDVVIPEGVTAIGGYAFGGATGLTSISLPETLNAVGDSPFYQTRNLTQINVAPNNLDFASVDGVLFGRNGISAALIAYPANRNDSTYTTPRTVSFTGGIVAEVTTIRSYAFQRAQKLATLTVSEDVTTLGGGFEASLLSVINLPESLNQVDSYPFYGTSNLSQINVAPNNPTYTSVEGVLFGRDGINAKLITYPANRDSSTYTTPNTVSFPDLIDAPVTSIATYAFQKAQKLATLNISEGVTTLGGGIAESTSLLSVINLPSTYTVMTGQPFGDAHGLTSITIQASVVSIASRTFFNAWSLSNIYFLGDEPVVANDAFSGIASGAKAYVKMDANGFDLDGTTGKWKGLTAVDLAPDGDYVCSTGSKTTADTLPLTPRYKITNGVVSDGSSCAGTVLIPDGIKAIGNSGFEGATTLTSITIPAGVISIGDNAFLNTTNLASFTVEADNPNYSVNDGVLLNKTGTTLLHYPVGKTATSYSIPSDVTSIGSYAFYGENSLTSITIPTGLTSIGNSSFRNTAGLTSINLPASLNSIGDDAFSFATALTSITIPANVANIGSNAFDYAVVLSSVYFLGDAPIVGTDAFANIATSSNAYIKTGNTTFSPVVNGKWNNLTVAFFNVVTYEANGGSEVRAGVFTSSGTLPAPTVPTRGGYGFAGWSITDGGAAVVFPYAPGGTSDITLFANWLEDGNFLCSGGRATDEITNIFMITDGVVSNGTTCTGDVVIPEGVNAIAGYAFTSSVGLSSISLPVTLSQVATDSFYGIPGLTEINVASTNSAFTTVDGVLFGLDANDARLIAYPASRNASTYTTPTAVSFAGGPLKPVKFIQDFAFLRATRLTSVTISAGVTSIGDYAFDYATQLTSVTIPAGVTRIGDYAFSGTRLTSITIPAGDLSIGVFAFVEASLLSSIYFLGIAPTVGTGAFNGIGPSPKAFVKNANLSSFTLVDGKWNDLTVEIGDPPVIDPPVIDPPSINTPSINTPAPVVDTAAQLAAADLAARTVGVKKSFAAKSLAANVGIKTVSPKAKVTFSIAKSSKKFCSKSGSKIKTLSVGNCVVTFTVQEPKPKKGKKPKATKTVKTLVVQ